MSLHFAFLLYRYFPYGGAQRDCIKIARAAMANGHRVRLYVAEWDGPEEDGIDICRVPVTEVSNHARLQQFASVVKQELDANPVDVTLCFHRLPGFDALFAADPCDKQRIRDKFGVWADWLPRYRSQLQREAAIFSPQGATRILLLNPAQRAVFQRHYGTPDDRFVDVGPSVDSGFGFDAQHAQVRRLKRAELQLSDDDIVLLMVGCDFVRKGVDRAVRAMAALPKALRSRSHLLIAGHGKRAVIEKLAHRLAVRDRVQFLGGRDDTAALMHAADVLLQPSRMELAGMTIVEAICSGLPVIASGECGYAFHVARSGAGVALAVPFSQTDFNTQLTKQLDPDALLRGQNHAVSYAANVDLRSMAKQIVASLEQVAVQKQAR